MNRRKFLGVCGCMGIGMIIGLALSETARAANAPGEYTARTRKAIWMPGSARTGCARLPHVASPNAGVESPDFTPYP